MSSDTRDPDEEILTTLYGFLERFPKATGHLGPDTKLADDLSLDSVNLMELLVEIEDHFDVGLPLNMMADITTVRDLACQIAKLVEERS